MPRVEHPQGGRAQRTNTTLGFRAAVGFSEKYLPPARPFRGAGLYACPGLNTHKGATGEAHATPRPSDLPNCPDTLQFLPPDAIFPRHREFPLLYFSVDLQAASLPQPHIPLAWRKANPVMSYRPFSIVEMAPPDPILGIVEQYNKETNPKKVNLCIGVYQDDTGANPVLKSVKQAEKMWLEQETTKDYLPMTGDAALGRAVQEIVFGADSPVFTEKRAATLICPGGTGALRVGADFLHGQFPKASVWISDPTWPNHRGIFQAGGLGVKTYPYYDDASHALVFDKMLASLEKVPEGDVVLLHACCHNPTGCDPTPAQWDRVVD